MGEGDSGVKEPFLWRGKTAMVTGASSGIGADIARGLAREGMRVVACARRRERLEELQRQVQGYSGTIEAQEVDLRKEEEIAQLFAHVRARFGGVDILINNAGLGHRASLVDGETWMWREMLEVNVLALCVCTREAIQDMRTRGDRGHIIHISSMAAHRVPPESGVYSATKYAVRSLTEGLRQELRQLGSDIRITAISPGFVETEFAALYHRDPAAAEQAYGQYPVLQPEDVTESVLYILRQPPRVQIHDILMRPTHQPR